MKMLIGFILVLSLTACVSLQDLRNGKPDLTVSSDKPVNIVSNCILNNWQESTFRYGNVFIQDNINFADGKTIYSESQSEMSDVYTVNGQTKVDFYHQKALFFYRVNERITSIKKCL